MNDKIVLHVAGDFVTGGEEAIDEVKKFICNRRSKPVAEQIQCIWYCMDSHLDPDYIDERFLSGEFDTGETPIFVIFTGYNKLIDEVRSLEGARSGNFRVEKEAFREFRDRKKKGLELSDYNPKVKICRTGITKGVEYFPSAYRDNGKLGR